MSRKELIGLVACLLLLAGLVFFVGGDENSACLKLLDPGLKSQMSDADREHCERLRQSR